MHYKLGNAHEWKNNCLNDNVKAIPKYWFMSRHGAQK